MQSYYIVAFGFKEWRFSHCTLLTGKNVLIITVGMSYGHEIFKEDWFTMLQ